MKFIRLQNNISDQIQTSLILSRKTKLFYFISLAFLVTIISISYNSLNTDDEYIFYTYAKNISLGKGFTFNQGERINATTSPLFTLLIASINYISGPAHFRKIPYIGKSISFISLLLLVYCAYRIMKVSGFKYSGYLFALLILVNPYLKNSAGMETQFALMLGMATVLFYITNRFELTAVAGALACLARPDNILIMIVIFIYFRIIHKSLPPTASIILFLCIVLSWFIFSYFYFNSILPPTLWIKMRQHTLGYWGNGLLFIKGFITQVPGGFYTSFILMGLFVLCLAQLILNNNVVLAKDFFWIILAWSVLYFLCYGFILNPPGYPWYYTVFVIPFGMVFSVSMETALSKHFAKSGLLVVFIIILITGLVLPIKTLLNPWQSKYNTYLRAAELLNKSKAGSSVLIDEIGIFGFYYTNGKVIDLLGLINPEIIDFLKKQDYTGLVEKYHPDYLVVDYPERPVYERFTRENEFLNSYFSACVISGQYNSVEIYSRK